MGRALQFVVLTAAGWLGCPQQEVYDYLLEENRVLREQLGGKRLRFTDAQRRRLAMRGRRLGRRTLQRLANIASSSLARLTCAYSSVSSRRTITMNGTIGGSATSCCNSRPNKQTRTPPCDGANASAAS